MENPASTASNRLYRMMQSLLAAYASRRVPEPAPPRGIVEEQDALDAIVNLAAYLDGNMQAGRLAANDAEHMAAMLMVVRDYVRPLPAGSAPAPAPDGAARDLRRMVDALRVAREQEGRRG